MEFARDRALAETVTLVENRDPAGTPVGRIVGSSPLRLWGMTSSERLRRLLTRAGIREVGDWTGSAGDRPQILMRADWVFDEPLVKDLVRKPGTVLIDPVSGEAVAAHVSAADAPHVAGLLAAGGTPGSDLPSPLRIVGPAELTTSYNDALRKKEPPYLLRLTAETVQAVEDRMFAGSYKGVTDLVTKYAWPWPAQRVTKWCSLAGLSPNQVTSIGFVLVLAAQWLFWEGHFLWGLLAAWIMTFLDTVDGKLARVTLTSSKWGNIFDHGIDLIHPPFWWWAWIVGLSAVGMGLAHEGLVLAVVLGGYVLQRVQEGIFMRMFGMHIHVWRPFDSWFRLITARRNPNLILLTVAALAGRPDIGMLAVAVWTAICLVVHGVQLVQALIARRHGPLVSWLSA